MHPSISYRDGRDTQATATSSALPTSSSSPLPSPSSPTPEGLSRRQSWNRDHHDDGFELPPALGLSGNAVQARYAHGHSQSLAPPSLTRLIPEDLRNAHEPSARARRLSDGENAGLGLDFGRRPFFHQIDSASSLDTSPDSAPELSNVEDDYDRSHLAPDSSGVYSSPNRSPTQRRPYDAHGFAPARSPRAIAASVSRSPTFRAVSQTLRDAGSRVASIISPEARGSRMEEDGGYEMNQMSDEPEDMAAPAPATTAGQMRGTTLGVFGPHSRVRRIMYTMMTWA